MINYTDTHREIIKAFQDVCYWNYEVWCALKVMCRYEYKEINYHMYRVIKPMHEYWMLSVFKLLDSKFTLNDSSKSNLVVAYVTEEIPWPEAVKDRLSVLKSQMESFASQLKPARHKVLAHHDLKVHIKHSDEYFGGFSKQDDERFYQCLLEFLDLVQEEISESPSLEWPPFAEDDAQEFMEILKSGGYAVVDD